MAMLINLAGQQLRFQAGMQHGGGLGAGSFSEKKDGGQIADARAFGKLCGG
jgi:hypothetical protein